MALNDSRYRKVGNAALLALAVSICTATSPVAAQDSIGQFNAALDPQGNDNATFFRRMFGAKRSINRDAIPASDDSATAPPKIMFANANPNFERWQRNANERLNQEEARRTPKQHPLAVAHPSKSVVVCEAGCGMTTADSIIYIGPIVSAVFPASDTEKSGSWDPAAANLGDGELPCIAGCYARASVYKQDRHDAHTRIIDGASSRGSNETSFVLTATSPRPQHDDKHERQRETREKLGVTTITATQFYEGWRTKNDLPRSSRSKWLDRHWQRQSHYNNRLIILQ